MKKLYLVDVSAFYFRAFYAIRPLTSPNGLPVNAIYGFLAMITKLIKDERPDYVAFCYDRKEPSFRKALYEDYKANRSEMPEDLAKQIPYMRKVTDLLGIPALELESFEADDLIGTLTRKALEKNLEVVIVSGDKDFAQLVTDHVILYDTMKDTRLGPVGVQEKWGVRPDQFIDYLAIVGDTSDNIPGVRGIGEKGAQKLLKQFASLKDIYAHLDQVEPKGVREKLIASQDQAFLSQKLVTIVCDAPVEVEIETLKQRGVHREGLRELLQELNFKSFEKNLLGTHDRPVSEVPAPTEASAALAVSAPESPNEGTPSAIQSNGKSQDSQNHEVVLADWSELAEAIRKQREAFAFLWQGQLIIATADLQKYASLPELTYSDARSLLAQCELSGFDLKNLCHVLDLRHDKFQNDVMLMAYVIRGRDSSNLAELIKEFSKEHFQEELPDIVEETRVLSLLRTMKTEYQKSLLALEQLRVYSDIEMPLLPVLLKMEQEGIKIDTQLLASESVDLAREIEDSRKEIIHLAGEEFNVASTKQLGHILFEKLGLPAAKKTKTGFSTDNDVLQNINHPIAPLILKFRELSKLKSTYVDAIPKLCGADQRVHTTFNQALTNTGRLSSVNPNLQNIPIRTERGQRVRKAFVAEEGSSILSMDYSQIELRLLAHCSNDEGLIRAFQNDLDIH
ncbi:MAG TPA: DNA polymerase I, partial [Pseudobdellovibrionaceae bacterium]|nr:DNA polymerase I [Pseudobdellovibrionaceae bacterium]